MFSSSLPQFFFVGACLAMLAASAIIPRQQPNNDNQATTCTPRNPSLYPQPLTISACDGALGKFSSAFSDNYLHLTSGTALKKSDIHSPFVRTDDSGLCQFTLSLVAPTTEVRALPKELVEFAALSTIGQCVEDNGNDGGKFSLPDGKVIVEFGHVDGQAALHEEEGEGRSLGGFATS